MALGVVLGAIALAIVLAFLAGLIGGDAEGLVYVAGLVGLPAFLLLVPVALVVVVVDYAGRRAYPAKPIVASWNVILDGELHVVSLPSSRMGGPRHAWVDGVEISLAWVPTGFTGSRATLDAGSFAGTLLVRTDAKEAAAEVGFGILTAILGTGAGRWPTPRYALLVEGADVDAVAISDGERCTIAAGP